MMVNMVGDDRIKLLRRWMGTAAARAGRRHEEKEEEGCEDVAAVSFARDVAIIVVSDGAGSARYSAQGAAIAAQTTMDFLRKEKTLWHDRDTINDIKKELVDACIKRMGDHAISRGCKIEDLATTLAFVAVKGGKYFAGNVGDGLIVAARWCDTKLGTPCVLIGQDRGEFVNQTVFLTSKEAIRRFNVAWGTADSYDGFIIMSDGAAERLYARNSRTLAPFIGKLFDSFEKMTSNEVKKWLDDKVLPQVVEDDDGSLGILRRVRVGGISLRKRTVYFTSCIQQILKPRKMSKG